MHEGQVQRPTWPDFARFDRDGYPAALLRSTAPHWWRRARLEYGSVHEFSLLLHTLTSLRAPIEFTGALARLLTDEARHVELCRDMALAIAPSAEEDAPAWPAPAPPFPTPPAKPSQAEAETLAWAADVVLTSCCIGETVSRPMYDALVTVTTDEVPRAVLRQILRDEHLHAAFGWAALEWLLPQLDDGQREWLQARLSQRLGSYERSCTVGVPLSELAGKELVLSPAETRRPDAPPNSGTLTGEQFAMIFYATLEAEILPRFEGLGFDAMGAWAARSL